MASERVILRDGTPVELRPIAPEDRAKLAEGFERLSPESRYRRFFSPVSQLSERQLDYLTRVDHHDHEALVAIDEGSGRLVGVARFVRTGRGEAEPAMVVADDWHGRGIATLLLDRLVARALDEGITTFDAPVLAGNAEAIAVLQRLGDTTMARRGTEVELRIALEAPAEPVAPLRLLLRAMASGTLDPALTFWHRLLPRRRPDAEGARANVVVVAIEHDAAGDGGPALALAQRVAGAAGAQVVVVVARHRLLDDAAAVGERAGRLAARLRAHGIEARSEVRAGDLGAVTLDVAAESQARLIVVEDPPGADPSGRLLGEPWDHISHHAPCNVLVAR